MQIDLTSSISTTLPFEALKQVGPFIATDKAAPRLAMTESAVYKDVS